MTSIPPTFCSECFHRKHRDKCKHVYYGQDSHGYAVGEPIRCDCPVRMKTEDEALKEGYREWYDSQGKITRVPSVAWCAGWDAAITWLLENQNADD
jgi:hypothetical protein